MKIELRPVAADDEAFLFDLYRDTRAEEMTAWGLPPAQMEAILRLQYNARQQSYDFQYRGADHRVIVVDNRPVGRLLVFRTAEEFRLVDIALLGEFRGAGIGTRLIEDLIDEAVKAGKPVRLHVEKLNRAARLYERLGFVMVADKGAYLLMERAS